ncbi:MAG: hypothetical protein ACFFEF_12110 [Candidatus Thorarchaeota archaeon]
MRNRELRKGTLAVFTVILMSSLLVFSVPTIAFASTSSAAGDMGTILIDYSHGSYKASAEHLDQWLADNLTLMGFEVIFLWGGLNSTILADADGLILPKVWGAENGYLAEEVTVVADWFNAGNKFLWVGGESDFVEAGGGQAVLDNQTLILEAVGSHVYHEPTAVQDPGHFAGAAYRPIANITTDNPKLAGIVEGVEDVLVHSPTSLYGSDSTTPGEDVSPVALETVDIENVYVLLQHSETATIVDSDLVEPYAHSNGETGPFASVTLETHAGEAGTGAIVVSGGNVIGHYWPMMEDTYAGVEDMDGMRFVKNLIQYGMLHAMTEQGEGKILFDYSHGTFKASAYPVDQRLYTSLFLMGYDVVEVYGGLNDTILADADGLVLPKVWGAENGYLQAEITSVSDWFNAGNKFLWVGGESDFVEAGGGQAVLDNQTLILEAVGSHVYHEPTAVQDPGSFAGAAYRPVATIVGDDPFVAPVVNGVTDVLVHSPTCLYGSDSTTPGEDVSPVALQTVDIENVYVLLQYSATATIVDSDLVEPYAHSNGATGSFVAMTMEVKAGTHQTGVIVVSGGNVIGHYWPMMEDTYAGVTGLNGLYLVRQAIHFGMNTAQSAVAPFDPTILLIAGIGAVIVVIVIIVVVRRK